MWEYNTIKIKYKKKISIVYSYDIKLLKIEEKQKESV